ncbi:MAG TPA: HD domain-containing protein [Selenomonadales bacterium]|nr:HD domain-containing protein [Selenomonadales bacterium]
MAKLKSSPQRFRDPLYGFIEVSPLELQIVDSAPFQRLRGIHQLGLTHLVYHGAEHTRFGHSLGVMHLVTRAFDSVVSKNPSIFSDKQQIWFRQILRLIALTHDLGHPPFSHASEKLFPKGTEHEDLTEKIIKDTGVAKVINEIGAQLETQLGSECKITPDLICDIYLGRTPENPLFIFLRKFMDSELDCDKMDYLLRDSLYCGVSYGKYDLDRLLSSLTVYQKDAQIRLAVEKGGIHAVEEFILARYFMFVQVYFHRTRRMYDKMLTYFLQDLLPKPASAETGVYPTDVNEFLEWDDAKVWALMRENAALNEWAHRIIERDMISLVYESPSHSDFKDKQIHNMIYYDIKKKFSKENIVTDSADKLPHKIPAKHDINDEKAIPIVEKGSEIPVSLSTESEIIFNLTKPINILRIYAKESVFVDARTYCEQRKKEMFGDGEDD